MMKYVVIVALTIAVTVAAIFGPEYLGGNQQEPTPAPIPLDKGAIIDALQKESKLIVVEQDYTIPFELPNEVRQRMLETIKNDKTILDKLAIGISMAENYFVGESIEMVGKGRVVLAVDLKSMTTEDVVQNGDVITIKTPPVRVYDVIVDQEASFPTKRDRTFWLKLMDNDDLRNQAQAEIRPVIMKKACNEPLTSEGKPLMSEGQDAAREAIANLLKLVVPSTMTLVVEVDVGSCALP